MAFFDFLRRGPTPNQVAFAQLGYPLRSTPGPGPKGSGLDAFQWQMTASGEMAPLMRQWETFGATPQLLNRWPGPATGIGRQWQPKLRGNAGLKNHGQRATWDTLTLSPAYIPMARVQQRQSVRYQTSAYRPAGTFNVPAIFVSGSARNFIGGLGKP